MFNVLLSVGKCLRPAKTSLKWHNWIKNIYLFCSFYSWGSWVDLIVSLYYCHTHIMTSSVGSSLSVLSFLSCDFLCFLVQLAVTVTTWNASLFVCVNCLLLWAEASSQKHDNSKKKNPKKSTCVSIHCIYIMLILWLIGLSFKLFVHWVIILVYIVVSTVLVKSAGNWSVNM